MNNAKKPKIVIKNQWGTISGSLCLFMGLLIYFVLIPLTIQQRSSIASSVFFSDARFVPKIWGVLLIFLSIGAICENLAFYPRKPENIKTAKIDKSVFIATLSSTGVLFVAMCLYVFFLPILGFVISSALLVGVALWMFEYRHPIVFPIIVLVTTLGVYFVWVKFLYVMFPAPVFPFPLS